MIALELLDYKYDDVSNNQINFNLATVATADWNVVDTTKAEITTLTTGSAYIYPVTGTLTDGVDYKLTLVLSNKTGAGDMGFDTVGSAGSAIGITLSMRGAVDGTYEETFTASGSQGARIFADTNAKGTIYARITQVGGINWDESVAGNLEVGNSDDFPLALSFSVGEARDLEARTGTYSKTFKIPATKHNNKVLKGIYNEGYYVKNNTVTNQKPCRITVDGSLTIVGLLQVTGLGQSTQPLYYSCVFYGNNVDWAAGIGNKLLKNLSVLNGVDGSGWDNLNRKGATSGIDKKLNYGEVVALWDIDDATTKTTFAGVPSVNTSPICYPQAGYGELNPGGATGMQLLKTAYEHDPLQGFNSKGYYGFGFTGYAYPTPVPCVDFRPGIFIYDIIKQLFHQEGYTISSNFIHSDMFKGLIMLLPNFRYNNVDERVAANSAYGSFEEGAAETGYVGDYSYTTPSIPSTQNWWEREIIRWDGTKPAGGSWAGTGNFLTTDPSSMYTDATGEFEIQEYGFYDISMDNISAWLQDVCGGTAFSYLLRYVRINCQVSTAGTGFWTTIATSYAMDVNTSRIITCGGGITPATISFENMLIENQWLNKTDKIRFQTETRLKHSDAGNRTMGVDMYLYGGANVEPVPLVPPGTRVSACDGRVNITHRGERVEYGQTFDVKNIIDGESTQLDFLQGVIHAFNLRFTTDTTLRVVTIEPYNDFFKNQNESEDWTNKVDLSRSQEDKWIQSQLKREVIFKYKTDSNDKVVEHNGRTFFNGILDEYPYREFLDSDFEVGQAVFENPFFAGTYSSQDGEAYQGVAWANAVPARANLWGLCDTDAVPTPSSSCRPPKGYNFLPRLVHYIKMATPLTVIPFGIRFGTRIQVWGQSDLETIIAGYSSMGGPPIIARACSVDKYTDFNAPTLPLSYGSANQASYDTTTRITGPEVGYKGLYQTYYQNMIEQLKRNPRIKIVYVNLKLIDINDLDLRKLVYIDGYYYYINRIIDYKPNNNEVTKVELVLWEDLGSFAVDVSF